MKNLERLNAVVSQVVGEADAFDLAKRVRAAAEDDVLNVVLALVKPALPAISSKVEGLAGPVKRAVALGGSFYLGEEGDFFERTTRGLRILGVNEMLDALPLPALVAVLGAALENQVGRRAIATQQIQREAAALRAIAQAFKVGGIR